MTEITQYRPAAAAEITYGPDFGSELIGRAVQQMAGAAKLGEALAMTAFVPAAFRGKPDDAAAAIMYGAALGLDPMTSLRAVYVVSGTPGLYARQMVAVVIARGHKVWTVESTDASVTVSGQRRGSDVVETVTWTYERARKAGYTSNKKYDTDPQAMLWARAAGDVARRIAPDALAGLDYSVEELQVIDYVDVSTERPKRESAATLIDVAPGRAATACPREEPAVAAAEPAATADRPMMGGAPDGATAKQVQAINIALKARGVGTKGTTDQQRDEKLAWLSDATERPITSSKDLTKVEAGTLLDHFAAEDAAASEPAPVEEPPTA